jgi:hypothetical protein
MPWELLPDLMPVILRLLGIPGRRGWLELGEVILWLLPSIVGCGACLFLRSRGLHFFPLIVFIASWFGQFYWHLFYARLINGRSDPARALREELDACQSGS